MNAQAILQKIEDDAQQTVRQMKADAQRKAEALTKASGDKMQTMHDQLVKQAQAEGEVLKDHMRRMAELDSRKQLLQRKQQVMDEAFAAAREELCGQPAAQTRAFMLDSLAKAAQGDETLLVGAKHDGWFDQSFLNDLNGRINGSVTLAEGRRKDVTGAVLVRGGTEVHVTYESMLNGARIDLETEIANILFIE